MLFIRCIPSVRNGYSTASFTIVQHLVHSRIIAFSNIKMHLCDNKGDNEIKIPEPPSNCCMSGCPNCVWLEYAEKLTKIFKDSGEASQEIILSKVEDENMKAFLKMELYFLRKRLKEKNNDPND